MCHSRPILTVVAVLAGIMLLAGFLAAPAQAELSWFGGGKPPGFITNPPSPGTMFCPINSPGYITEKPKPCQENTEEQRFRRIKLALEKQESGGADCATNGGCKARTANPFMPTLRFPLFFVFQKVYFMLPVFPRAEH